ncbi:MAG: hypothetical protein RR525_12045 [Cellulosilyticaceae bacterium]
MIIAVELLILCIGLTVFMMQHKFRQKMSVVASKLVYWTTLLFMSLTFNSILLSSYPNHYNLAGYWNLNSLMVIGSVVIGYIVLQAIAPSKYFTKLVKKFRRDKNKEENQEEVKIHEKNGYLKELHFETFLETVCWLAFAFNLALEGYMTLLQGFGMSEAIHMGLKGIVCLMMMATAPIIIRQIIFYLYRIRSMKEEQNLSEVEIKFHHKLRKENNRL